MKHIVIAVDKGESGIYAAEWAFQRIVNPEDDVTLISAVEMQMHYSTAAGTSAPAFDAISRTVQQDLHAERTSLLERMAEQLAEKEGQVHTRVMIGDPRDVIVDYAAEFQPDLLVIGSGSKGFLKRVTLGSVSDYVSHHCPCPVLLVKHPLPKPTASRNADTTASHAHNA